MSRYQKECTACGTLSECTYRCDSCGKDLVDVDHEEVARHV